MGKELTKQGNINKLVKGLEEIKAKVAARAIANVCGTNTTNVTTNWWRKGTPEKHQDASIRILQSLTKSQNDLRDRIKDIEIDYEEIKGK